MYYFIYPNNAININISKDLEDVLEDIKNNILAKPSNLKESLKVMKYNIELYLDNQIINNNVLDYSIELKSNDLIISIKENYFSPNKKHIFSFNFSFEEKIDDAIDIIINKLKKAIDLKKILKNE